MDTHKAYHGLVQPVINFNINEMACGCDECTDIDDCYTNCVKTLTVLQLLRGVLQMPITINSGWRCAKHNKAVSGSEGSRHLVGLAADISTANWSQQDIDTAKDWLTENRVFWINYDRHIHIDLRNQVQVSRSG